MVRFLVNPASGRGTGKAHLDRIRVLASRHGAGLVVSRKVADLAMQARRAAEDGVERLLVAGGDGTMHHVAQGLAGTSCANEVKYLRGSLIYFYSVIHTLATFKPPWMKVVYDGGVFEGKVMFTVVNNLPRFGGGMRIAPEARIDDGLLDLVIVREIPKPVLMSIFPKVYSGRHVGHPAVTIVRTRRAEITIDRPMTMYGGGEPVGPV